MLVYDERPVARNGEDALRAWRCALAPLEAPPVPHDRLVTALIDAGVFESAVADAICRDEDRCDIRLARLRAVSEALGAAVISSWWGDAARAGRHAREALALAATVAPDDVPALLHLRVPEGYAYYGLYPETYGDAAAAWADAHRPARVLCIGLRNIGASLSAVVAGALRSRGIAARSWTLRPRGHPYDRSVRLAPDLRAFVAPRVDDVVLIVDEGPGLSGSSMTGTAAAFAELGTPDDRIVLLGSWEPDVSRLTSAAARARWARHRAIAPTFDAVRGALTRDGTIDEDAIDISAGVWRAHLDPGTPWPAVHPQHERRKFLVDGGRAVSRFVGLGTFGVDAARRAGALADAGWVPPVLGLRQGFLRQRRAAGRPLHATDASRDFVLHAARYVAWLRRHASHEGRADAEPLSRMLVANAREALGPAYAHAAEALARLAEAFDEPATAVDGRLMPHEWCCPEGVVPAWTKTDALDHHRDHFFPGCTDAAWDVAGLLVELAPADRDGWVLVDEYAVYARDRAIRQRLPFFTAAYAAFRCGYASLAAQALSGTDDGRRFAALEKRYRGVLAATLGPSAR